MTDKTVAQSSTAHVVRLEGDLGSSEMLAALAAHQPDIVFHLASVPGGQAEREQALGRRVNVDATLDLFEAVSAPEGRAPPVLVFASTIAVYGAALAGPIDEHAAPRPVLTYGAHKLMGEIALADFTRRGLIDGRSLRLPGVVARPREPGGLASAFMSDMLHAVAAGEAFTCPVSEHATAWWMSLPCCIDNLLHGARMAAQGLDARRVWQLPVLRLSMRDVVDALARKYGAANAARVTFAPDAGLEDVFGRYPELDACAALALGFRSDGDAGALVDRALGDGC